jgi:4-alpha-glucanotransferase
MTALPTTRTAGILLHPTSLPGRLGIGSLGADARRFISALADMGQSWWQMLPIGPTGYGDSPYQSPSTFAGNPLIIDLDELVTDGILDDDDLFDAPTFPDDEVDFGTVIGWRMDVIAKATRRFEARATTALWSDYDTFVARHGMVWLDEFALFTAIKRSNDLAPWWEWERPLALRDHDALGDARVRLRTEIEGIRIEQFIFDRQFSRLRRMCAQHGIRLIGDIPIFVAHDSADVWANPELFFLDDAGLPTVVAGVPPDYFSETGQRWGNPIYDWERHRLTGYAWWTERMRRVFELFDLVRVDHFRGFAASWHIPASEPTAIRGEWVPAPGIELFDQLLAEFGRLPVIAEDLGVITPDVEALRDRYDFPGMKILQFGFGTESAHSIDKFRKNVVAYTGTHDNDTAIGWFEDQRPDRAAERARAMESLPSDGTEFNWDLIRGVMESVANTAVIPLQDVLGLDTTARMNTPATTGGNWRWRFTWNELDSAKVGRMRALTETTDRLE